LTGRRAAAFGVFVLLASMALPAAAQTPRTPRMLVVAADRVSMRERPSSTATIVQTLYRGEQLEIVEVSGDWYHVRIRNSARTGWVNSLGVQPFTPTESPGAPRAGTPQGALPPIGRPAPKPPRVGLFSVNGAYQVMSKVTTDTFTPQVDAEPATFTIKQHVNPAAAFDINGGMVRGTLGVLIGFSAFQSTADGDLSGSVPHPFFFNQPRTLTATVPLTRTENALHLDVLFRVPLSPKLDLNIIAGPTIFFLKNDFVSNVSYTESYPYDTVTFVSATTVQSSKTALGFNAGVDVSAWLSKNVGVGGFARFSIASVDWQNGGGATTNVDAGGAQVGGGLRFRF
jgi:hypothetical protein